MGGFKFHPAIQGFFANHRLAYPLYEAIAEYGLPAVFHSDHSGMESGMRGGGLRLKYSEPIYLDDVAADFPDMKIVIAHPSWPWHEQALSIALHMPNVYIDLSGWSPKSFSPELAKYANTLLPERVLFASDFLIAMRVLQAIGPGAASVRTCARHRARRPCASRSGQDTVGSDARDRDRPTARTAVRRLDPALCRLVQHE
ncbi:hypothetical protein PSAC2689_10131 [Paraburkholderia sacchari]